MKELKKKTVRGIVFPGKKQIEKWKGANHPTASHYFQEAIRKYLGVGPEWYIHKTLYQCRLGDNEWYVHIELWSISRTEWDKRRRAGYEILLKALQEYRAGGDRWSLAHAAGKQILELEVYPFHREVHKPCLSSHYVREKSDPTVREMETYRAFLREQDFVDRVFTQVEDIYKWKVREPKRIKARERKAVDVEKMHAYALELLREGISLRELEERINKKFPWGRDDKASFYDLKIDPSYVFHHNK